MAYEKCFTIVTPEKALKAQVIHVKKKPVFRVSDQVQHKQSCTATKDRKMLEISDDCTIYVVKTKALLSCAVNLLSCAIIINPQLICTFFLFSHMQKAGFLMTRLKYSKKQMVLTNAFDYVYNNLPGVLMQR